jgi:para-nitrobenzyl esterase
MRIAPAIRIAMAATLGTIPLAPLWAGAPPAATTTPIMTDAGPVRGIAGEGPGFRVFKGIPYAAPPVGPLRWAPPRPAARWSHVLTADHAAPDCYSPRPADDSSAGSQSEDCLYLNIYAPAPSRHKVPVMVWIYGGGFSGGSPAVPRYDGAGLNRKGVMLVTFGYRTSVFGFLSHPLLSAQSPRHVSGNYGLLDAIAALQWVRRNIAAFGGDPANVTIFGQSSGSESVNALTLSPLAHGLFAKAIGESGGGFGQREPLSLKAGEAEGAAYAAPLGQDLAALRALSPAQLVAAIGNRHFEPVVDGWFLPADAHDIYAHGHPNDVPTLLGSNEDEAQLAPTLTRQAYLDRLTQQFGAHVPEVLAAFPAGDDAQARQSAKALGTLLLGDFNTASWARGKATTGPAPVWQYRFVHRPPVVTGGRPQAGAYHGAEIPYAFNNLARLPRDWTPQDRALEATMTAYWTNFAKTGDPNGPGLPRWDRLNPADPHVLVVGDTPAMAPRPNAAAIALMERIFYGPGGVHRPAQ